MILQVRIPALRTPYTLNDPCCHNRVLHALLNLQLNIFRHVEVVPYQCSSADEFLVQITDGIFAFCRLVAEFALLQVFG